MHRVQYPDFSVDFFMLDTNMMDAHPKHADPKHNICGQQNNPPGASCNATGGPKNLDDCFSYMWEPPSEVQSSRLVVLIGWFFFWYHLIPFYTVHCSSSPTTSDLLVFSVHFLTQRRLLFRSPTATLSATAASSTLSSSHNEDNRGQHSLHS